VPADTIGKCRAFDHRATGGRENSPPTPVDLDCPFCHPSSHAAADDDAIVPLPKSRRESSLEKAEPSQGSRSIGSVIALQ
jgi:hypothetical protein